MESGPIDSVANPSLRAWLRSIRYETNQEDEFRVGANDSTRSVHDVVIETLVRGSMLSACCRAVCPCLSQPIKDEETLCCVTEESRVTYNTLVENLEDKGVVESIDSLTNRQTNGQTNGQTFAPPGGLSRTNERSSFLSLHYAHESAFCFASSKSLRSIRSTEASLRKRRHSTPGADEKVLFRDAGDSFYRLTWPLSSEEDDEGFARIANHYTSANRRSGFYLACSNQVDPEVDQVICKGSADAQPTVELDRAKETVVDEVLNSNIFIKL